MALSIQGRIFLQIRINGVDLPIKENSLDFMHIVESVRVFLPVLTFKYQDLTNFLTRNTLLVDGAIIEVTIEVNKFRQVRFFRHFSHTEITSGYNTYIVRAYLDVARYWVETAVQSFHGSASACLQNIAALTGLTYDGITTADNQLWLPRNQKFRYWARETVDRAWVSDSSCIKLAILSNKTMRVRDVSKLLEQQVVQSFSNKDNAQSQTPITDYEPMNKAGFFNSTSGYKDALVTQSILEDDVIQDNVTFTKNSKQSSLNKGITKGIAQGRVTFSPIDVGNVSPTYEKAMYQNGRLSNLFTFGINFLTPDPVVAELLDPINLEVSKAGLEGVQQYSGKFMLTTKVLYLQGLNFYQKCEVARHGLNTSSSATQL